MIGGRLPRELTMTTLPRIMTTKSSLHVAALAALLSALACAVMLAPAAVAQEDATLKRVMELNRNGEWGEAERLARSFLAAGAQKPLVQRCEALYDLTYAQTRFKSLTPQPSYSREAPAIFKQLLGK